MLWGTRPRNEVHTLGQQGYREPAVGDDCITLSVLSSPELLPSNSGSAMSVQCKEGNLERTPTCRNSLEAVPAQPARKSRGLCQAPALQMWLQQRPLPLFKPRVSRWDRLLSHIRLVCGSAGRESVTSSASLHGCRLQYNSGNKCEHVLGRTL
jgi:hypothetical protein